MAFTTSSGYGNLPSGNFAPSIFSQKVLKFFRRASVAEDITNTDYTGEIENFGDTVNIIKEPTLLCLRTREVLLLTLKTWQTIK